MTQPNWTEKAEKVFSEWQKEWVMNNKHDKRCTIWLEGYYPPMQDLIKTALQEAYEQGVEDSAKVNCEDRRA